MSLRGTSAEAGGPKQSHKPLKTRRLPRSLRSLAMTKRDWDTVPSGGEVIRQTGERGLRRGGGFLRRDGLKVQVERGYWRREFAHLFYIFKVYEQRKDS